MTTRHLFLPTLGLALAATVVTSAAVRPALQRTQRTAGNWCNNNNGDDRATFNEVRDFSLPASGATLTVDASPNGGIRVAGESRGDIQGQACVTATAATDDEARAIAQRVEVTATAQRVSAEGPQNLGRRESWHVSYRLTVPNRTSLSLRTVNGGISLDNVDGDIDFRTVNGGVSLARVAGKVQGGTTNGGVDVELEGSTWNGDGLDVETQNGGVQIAIPANYSARLETGTVNGRINIDFPVTVQGRIGRSIETQLGTGGPLIKVRTSNGGVNIRRK
jgi:hypothetical protein